MREAIELVLSLTFDVDAAQPLETQVADCLNDIGRLYDADSTTGVSLSDIVLLDQRSEHEVMDQRARSIVLHAPCPDPADLYADDRRDSAANLCPYLNHYRCDCGEAWTDQWSCACDDRCPACNAATAPSKTVDLISRDQIAPEVFDVRMTGALIAALEMLASEMAEPDFESGYAMTARGMVAPVATLDVERLIATLTAQLRIKRSKLALGRGVQSEAVVAEEERAAAADVQIENDRTYVQDGT